MLLQPTAKPDENTDRLLTAREVGQYLGFQHGRTYRLLREGEIPVIRIGRTVRVRLSDLETFIESHTDHGDDS